jgi:cell wall-associated NlpC family hydrolase
LGVFGHRPRGVPVAIGVVAVLGTVIGVVLATVGGQPAGVPVARPSVPARSSGPVVPLLGGVTQGSASAVPVAPSPGITGAPVAATPLARVAPLHGLREADLLVVAPSSLSGQLLKTITGLPSVTSAVPIEAARVEINGVFTAVLGVDPSSFRGYAASATAASNPLWQGVANGGIAISFTMGKLDKLALGGRVTVAGRKLERLPVVAFGTVGIGGVDAVVSDSVARSLGMPDRNAIVVSAPPADVPALITRIKQVLPRDAGVEALVTQVASPSAAGLTSGTVTTAGVAATGGAATSDQLLTALRAAETRRGLPYVWGAAGPGSFDCSGLVQWSFAQAGITMPRVAADQARTGLAIPVSELQAGDLLFYHTDPTAPGYISHVAIYLGNGLMIQAPQPGMNVEVVPASFDSEFAGAVRVYPRIAAAVAAGLA